MATKTIRIRKAAFPDVADLADVPGMDSYDASRALSVLYRLCSVGLATVYQPHMIHDRWNVWLEVTRRRVELTDWAQEWLASQDDEDESEGA